MNKIQRLVSRLRAKGVSDEIIKGVKAAYRTGHPRMRTWKEHKR